MYLEKTIKNKLFRKGEKKMKNRIIQIVGLIFLSLMTFFGVFFAAGLYILRSHNNNYYFSNFFPTDVLRIINKMSVNYFIFLLCFIATMGFVMIFAFAQEGQKGERDERNENT
jgi:hypothetical protein